MLNRRLESYQMDDNVSAGVPVIKCRWSSAGAEEPSITESLGNSCDWDRNGAPWLEQRCDFLTFVLIFMIVYFNHTLRVELKDFVERADRMYSNIKTNSLLL